MDAWRSEHQQQLQYESLTATTSNKNSARTIMTSESPVGGTWGRSSL